MDRSCIYFIVILTLVTVCYESYADCPPDQYPFNGCDTPHDELVWDQKNSIETMDTNATAVVSVVGGIGIYTWSINGNGFYFDKEGALKTIQTDTTTVNIYTINACGAATITVSDSCQQVDGYVQSSKGNWVSISPVMDCLSGGTETAEHVRFSFWSWTMETQRYRQYQNIDSWAAQTHKVLYTLPCYELPEASSFQEDADEWCYAISISNELPTSSVYGCTSGYDGAPNTYCANNKLPLGSASVSVNPGRCLWGIPTSINVHCAKKCVRRNSWQEFQCGN